MLRGKLTDWIAATHGTCALFDFPTKVRIG